MSEFNQDQLAAANNYVFDGAKLAPYSELVARNLVNGEELVGIISDDGVSLRIDADSLGDSDWVAVEDGIATERPVVLS